MIRPKEMEKVSIIGPKPRMEQVIERLHDLGVLHIDDYEEDIEGLELGDPGDEAEELSDRLVKVRSLRSRLPEAEETQPSGNNGSVDDIEQRIDSLETQLENTRQEIDENETLRDNLETVAELGLDLDDIRQYDSVDIYLGAVNSLAFQEELEAGRYDLYSSGKDIAVFADNDLDVEKPLRAAGFDPVPHEQLMEMEGDVDDVLQEVDDRIQELRQEAEQTEQTIQELAAEWRGRLEEEQAELEEELEKQEAPLSFATTDAAFIARGWIPADQYRDVENVLEEACDGSVHMEKLEEDGEAPVAHDNPRGVKPLESLMDVYGTPQYDEVNPTFLLLTFPILFGFMLGDFGYGIASFILFYALYRKFPGAKKLWYALMYTSVATIVFGLIYAEAFGFIVFGHDSMLAKLTGIHLFEQIPVLYHRTHKLGQVLYLSVLIGALHVNAGFLVGAYNEYVQHGLKDAVLAKLSWLVMEGGFGVAVLARIGMVPSSLEFLGIGIGLLGIAMITAGEGIEGAVEIPSLLSNILSYLRIFGVSMAVIVLAKVANALATPLFKAGGVMMVFGFLVLLVAHTFNTFIKIMEAGLQGIRLHYVEFFTKFYEGGGQRYRPFGGEKV